MTFRFKPEQEQLIEQAIRAGVIRDAGEVVEMGIESLRQRLKQHSPEARPNDLQKWLEEFHFWVHSHPTSTPLLTDEAISRDAIYRTCQ